MTMGLPSVNIIFQSKAIAAIEQGSVGICAIVLKDASVTEVTEVIMTDVTDTPDTLSATNQKYLQDAFLGTPKTVKAVVIPETELNYTNALNYLETIQWNIGAIPGIAEVDVATVGSWAKSMRDTKERKVMFVLPNYVGDHEGIINFATDDIKVGANTYTASQYSARIAGIIAGLSLTVAPTYYKLTEVTDVPHLTKVEADTAVGAGKLILYNDGKQIKIARGVTSLTTTTETKGEDWKKIKLVRILDRIYSDVKETIEDVYVGKYQNSYTNKILLIAATNAYYEQLELDRVLDNGQNTCEINIPAQKVYLQSIGVDTSTLTEQQIKEMNTRDKVFLVSYVRPLDAIEDVQIVVNL